MPVILYFIYCNALELNSAFNTYQEDAFNIHSQ